MKKILLILIAVFIIQPAAAFGGEERIAYTKEHNGFWQVWELEAGAPAPKVLTDTPVDKSYPDWSADGKRIAYVTSLGELWIINVADGKSFKVPLAIPAFQPKFSKSGKRILFMSPRDVFHDDTDIWSVDIDGKNLKLITKRPWAQTDPAWLPAQDEILYVDSPEIMGDEICKINLKTGDIIRLTTNKSNDIQPSCLANGESIVYASNAGGNYDIWLMDKFGQNPRNLTNDPSHNVMPMPSPDGSRVYFLSDRRGYLQIFSIDLKTNELKQITSDETDKKDFTVYAT